MATQVFNFIKQTRSAFIDLLDTFTVEQLNEIPEGFNNNIIWNFGHIVVSTQTLAYVRTQVKTDANFVKFNDDFKRDSKPSRFISEAEIAELKNLALTTIDTIETDFQNGVFNQMTPFATSTYKADLNTIEDVLITTSGHDNVHLGYALAQKRLIK